MYKFIDKIDPKKHDEFVEKSVYCNLLQSSSWATVKSNWSHEIVGVYEGETLVASSLVLIKKLPLSFTMMYLPRGPIMDYDNQELVQFFFKAIKKWAKKRHCLFIKLDPGIHYSDYHLGDQRIVNEDAIRKLKVLESTKVKHQGFPLDFSSTIQPRFHMVVYANEFGEDCLTKKGAKNLKIALKKHLDTKIGYNTTYLDDFSRVMNCTESRKGISLRNKDYYKLLLDTYGQNAFLTVTYLDLDQTYHEIYERYTKCQKDIEECPENATKKLFKLEETNASLTREVKFLEEQRIKHGSKVCVCGTLTVIYGKTSEILYAGMDNDFKRYMGPYLTWYKTIEECFERGCVSSNMGGVEGTLKGGLVDFKSVFHPTINEFIGEFDLPVNKMLYSLSEMAYKLRKHKNKHK